MSLELGGKSPDIVFADADLETAVPGAGMAVFANSGQICSAGTRLFVERKVYDEFVGRVADFGKSLKVGNGIDPTPRSARWCPSSSWRASLVISTSPARKVHAQSRAVGKYNRIERLRDPSHARALSLPELASLFSRCGLGQPSIIRYELPVELKDILARAFPNPGDEAEIAAVFTAAAMDGRLGIPVRQEGEAIHIAYQAAIFAASPGH